MKFVQCFVVLCICFTVLLHVASMNNTDICQLRYGGDVVIHTSYKDGTISCCNPITCDPGFEAVMCRPNDPSSTDCQPCPPNTFQSEPTNSADMKYCDDKRSCAAGMKVEDDDSKVKDRRCLCDLEKGYCNASKNRSNCQRRYCPPGMELNQDCSCTECLDGFFKDVNGSMPCKPWRNCRDERRQQVAEGTTTTDAECSNKTYNKMVMTVGALPGTKALSTTVTPESISSTSGLSAEHSRESSQSSSGLDQTTSQNESSGNRILVAIASVVAVSLAVLAVSICILICFQFEVVKRICTYHKPDRPADQPSPDFEAFLPNDQIAEVRIADIPPNREDNQPLMGRDTNRDGSPYQNEGCRDVVRKAAAPVRQIPTRQTPTSQTPASNTPDSQTPVSQTPANQTPANQTTASQTPASQTPASQTPANQTPASQTSASQTPASQTPANQTPARHMPASAVGPNSEMTCAMRQRLQQCRVSLLKGLDMSNLFLSVLGINDTITGETREIIQAEPTSSCRITKLLDYLLKRPCFSYKTFILALVYTKQPHLAEQIDAELAEEYKKYNIESERTLTNIVLSFATL